MALIASLKLTDRVLPTGLILFRRLLPTGKCNNSKNKENARIGCCCNGIQFSGLLQTWKKENAQLERLLGHRLQYGRDRKTTIIPQSQILELYLKRGISRLTAERELHKKQWETIVRENLHNNTTTQVPSLRLSANLSSVVLDENRDTFSFVHSLLSFVRSFVRSPIDYFCTFTPSLTSPRLDGCQWQFSVQN